ncbi:MAG: glycosyltransferase family 2 protein [Lachnospiraceae bacterium]|nr:glycosyltransferase family 2 protein [Lachnospiraceae bacterium]
MNSYTIDKKTEITSKLLDEIYEQLELGDPLVIERIGKKYDPQRDGMQLLQSGFVHVVQAAENKVSNGYTIHCIKADKRDKLLSVIVPLYNEEATAGELLDKLINRQWTMPVEFVLVESNSKDRTREIAKEYEKYPNVKLVLEEKPSGKGNGVLNGIKHASGNFIAIQDGDLEYDVNDYDKLLEPIINDEALFVLGSRYNRDDWHMRKFTGKRAWLADYLNLGQTLLTWLVNTACGCRLQDPFTMYKIFHKDCMYGINFVGGNFGLDWELVIRFIRKGYVPYEMPVSYKARSYEEGKHIALIGTPIEGLKMLWHCRFKSGVYDYGAGHKEK